MPKEERDKGRRPRRHLVTYPLREGRLQQQEGSPRQQEGSAPQQQQQTVRFESHLYVTGNADDGTHSRTRADHSFHWRVSADHSAVVWLPQVSSPRCRMRWRHGCVRR